MMPFFENVWGIWNAGGWTMIPLFGLSLLLYGSAVRLFVYFRQRQFTKVSESEWMQWIREPSRGQGEVGEIIRYSQDEVHSVSDIHNRFSEVIASKIPAIDRHLSYLNVMVSTAPLLGLLGTVTGMLITFKSIGAGGGEMTDMMAAGISAALFPPEVGLCIALPGLMMVHMLKQRRDEYDAFLTRLESFTIQKYKNNFPSDLPPSLSSEVTEPAPVPTLGITPATA